MIGAAVRTAIAVAVFSLAGTGAASAYIGPSFLQVPGVDGGWSGAQYKNWVRAEANYWTKNPPPQESRPLQSHLTFTPSRAPREGANVLNIAVDKHSPALKQLMEQCAKGATLPELSYAESSELSRHGQEDGPRPADIPEYYEYRLKDVQLSCPVVADAPEQAFVVKFANIERLNFQYFDKPREITSQPVKLPQTKSTGATKAFVVTWFSPVTDVSDDQCAVMNTKPSDEAYYALMSAKEAAAERIALAPKGGVSSDVLPYRGPGRLNVCLLPGIVADPGSAEPHASVMRGFNLDGDDGAGAPPVGTRAHKNYVSADGRTGIDNQLFTVEGCSIGQQRRGLFPMVFNEGRRNGNLSILVVVSGIDNERNDDHVDVTILYSNDAMAKDATGKSVLPDYTFRVSDRVEHAQYFARLPGRIVDGVVTTEPTEHLHIHAGRSPGVTLTNAQMRLAFMPDGTMKGVLGGYLDWRKDIAVWTAGTSQWEIGGNYQCPGLYNAYKRAADGLKDPVTGEFNGISAAYDLEGMPAFIPPTQREILIGRADTP